MATVLFVIAPGNFRDEELFHTKEELEKAGVRCDIASTWVGEFKGKLGGKATATKTVAEAKASDYDAVIFIGGPGVLRNKLTENKDVLKLAQDANDFCQVLAAICIAPWILASAGVVRGKKVTVFPDDEAIEVLKKAGANYTGADVEVDDRPVDRKLITADGPESARAFGKRIAKEIA